MSQFLAGYWWLIALLIIIIAVITRNLMKLITTGALIAAAFVMVWQFLISPGFTRADLCFSEAARSSDEIFEKAQVMDPGEARNRFICSGDEAGYQALASCLAKAKKENGISFAIYSSLPKFSKTIGGTIASHNQLCPESQLAFPNL